MVERLLELKCKPESLNVHNDLEHDSVATEGLPERAASAKEEQNVEGRSKGIENVEESEHRGSSGRHLPLVGSVTQKLETLVEDFLEMLLSHHVAVDCEGLLVLDLWAQQIVAGLVRCAMEGDSIFQEKHIEGLLSEELESAQSVVENSVDCEEDVEGQEEVEKAREDVGRIP